MEGKASKMSSFDHLPDSDRPAASALYPAQDVEQLLEKLALMLSSDGFGLSVNTEADRIRLTVVAGPEACKECLVPKHLFVSMVRDMLGKGKIAVEPSQIEVTYPLGAVEH